MAINLLFPYILIGMFVATLIVKKSIPRNRYITLFIINTIIWPFSAFVIFMSRVIYNDRPR